MLLCRNKSASTFSGLRAECLSSISLPAALKLRSEGVLVAGIASSFLATGTSPPDLSCQKSKRDWKRVHLESVMYCSTNWRPCDSILPLSSLSSSTTQLAKKLCTSVALVDELDGDEP
ncbi:hypothetical protein ILYODFUR_038389 [Ilyodon furcidens]|uniref:Uncharacterized protein n=1 Tax=Ilyodon furcidens TaxID=33524 RepID=A0ABV0VLA3_9TELE